MSVNHRSGNPPYPSLQHRVKADLRLTQLNWYLMVKEGIRHIIVVAIVTLFLGGILHWQLTVNAFQKQQIDITRQLATIRIRLENGVNSSFLLLEGVSNFISNTPDLTQEIFESYAARVFKGKTLLKNIGAAPDLVIRYVYPLKGNQDIVGKDYRTMSGQWPDVQRAIISGKLVTAGPLKLVQGGTGLIGRAPVFVTDAGKKGLWGIVSSVIDMDRLYRTAQLESSGLQIALQKKGGDQPLTFFGDPFLFTPRAKAVILPVIIPGARWEIAALPGHGWSVIPPHVLGIDLILILFGIWVGYGGVKSIKKNRAFREIRQSLDMSQAMSHLGSWSLDLKTGELWWSDETYRIFGIKKEESPPSMALVLSMIPEQDRERVEKAVEQSTTECGEYAMDHAIIRQNGSTGHVEARGFVHCGADGTPEKFIGTILDITSRKKTETELRTREAQMRAMARASHDALIMIDSSDTILFWSDAAEKMFGWTQEEARGNSMHRLITLPQDRKKALEGLKTFSRTGIGPVVGSVMEFEAVRRDGSIIPVERSVAAFQIGNDHFAVGSLRNITNRKKKENQLRLMATTDGLTGLFNRRHFMELVAKELKKSRRYNVAFSVIMFDADRFKRVNDTHGHEAGDRVLVDISRTLKEVMRETDVAGRIGGEEFAVGLPHTDLDGACQLAERLRAAFEASGVDLGDGQTLHYTVSLGVATSGRTFLEVEGLMKQADTALYQAKEKGRNRVEIHPLSPDTL